MDLIDELTDGKTLPDVILDRSTLQMVAACPHQYALHQKHQRPLTAVLPNVGIATHELIEEAFDYAEQSEGGIADAADYFASELPKSRPDLQPEILTAGKWVGNYILRVTPAAIIGYEQQVNTTIIPATLKRGDVKATACADLIMHGDMASYEIWDWKSGWKQRTDGDVRVDFQAQMLTWLWWQNVPDANEVTFTFIETRTGGKASYTFSRERYMDGMRTVTQEAAFGARVAQAARLLLSGSEEARPSPTKCAQCDYCDLCKHCAWEVQEIADDPAEFLRQYHVCKQVQSQRHKVITDWLKEGKELTAGELAANVAQRPSRFSWKIEKEKA